MFEEIISALQGMNIGYEEMADQGMLSVEVGEMDKMQLIELLNLIYTQNMTVSTLNESSMTISMGTPMPEEAIIEPIQEEETDEDAAQMAALDEAMSGM